MKLRSKVISALLSLALGTSLVASGTFTLYRTQASNNGNTFAAGTVKIASASIPVFSTTEATFSNLKPGDSGQRTIVVENTGTLDAWVRVKGYTTDGDIFSGLNPLVLSNQEVFDIPAGETRFFTIQYHFPLQSDNLYMEKSGTASIHFEGVQVLHNLHQPDQWGLNSYGISPKYSNFSVLFLNRYNITWQTLWVTLRDNNNLPISIVPFSEFKWFINGNTDSIDLQTYFTSAYYKKYPSYNPKILDTYIWSSQHNSVWRFTGDPNPSCIKIGNVTVNPNPPINFMNLYK